MLTPADRLQVAMDLLAADTPAADAAATHGAYYAAAHHIADRLGRTLANGHPNSVGHEGLRRRMVAALATHGHAIASWAALTTLRDRRERADYRPGDAPSHDEAEASVLAALAILSTDLPAAG